MVVTGSSGHGHNDDDDDGGGGGGDDDDDDYPPADTFEILLMTGELDN